MADPEMAALARAVHRRARLPAGAVCAGCGTAQHLAAAPDTRIVCYACRRAERGAGPTEADHPAGRRNLGGLTVNLRANDHRTVTELRTRIGTDAWPDAEGDPLLTAAHFLAGMATLLLLVAEWLVAAAHHIANTIGAGALDGLPPSPLVP
jgi:hypothetical protein